MVNWSHEPEAGPREGSYRIARTPTTQPFKAAILSEKHVGVHLHYWKGRSVPCNGGDCEACYNGQRPRWKGYVLVKSLITPKIVIFEFTERAHHAFADFLEKHGSLRGGVFQASRTNRRANGPLDVEFQEARFDEALLPKPGDLQAVLERMWEIRQQYLPAILPGSEDPQAEERRLA